MAEMRPQPEIEAGLWRTRVNLATNPAKPLHNMFYFPGLRNNYAVFTLSCPYPTWYLATEGRKVFAMKKSLKPYLAGGLIAAALSLSGPVQASVVTNGSFEDGLNGWTLTRGAWPEVHTGGTLPAQDGAQYIEMDTTDNAVIRQNVLMDVGRYVFSFWYSPNESGSAASSTVRYRLGGFLNGMLTGATTGVTVGGWTQVTVEFLVTATRNYGLVFASYGTVDGNGGYIDNVSIAPVPAPAAGFALLGGLGALIGLRRRKR